MKRLSLTAVFLLCMWQKPYSQTAWQWGFGAGSTVYFGDLGNEQYVPISGTHYGCSFSLRHDLKTRVHHVSGNEPFAFVVRGDWLRIGYDETHPLLFNTKGGAELRNYRRGLNFRNDRLGINAQITWTIYARKIFPLWQHRWALYFFIGPGIYYSDPRADLFRGNIDNKNRYYYYHDGTLRDAPETDGNGKVVTHDNRYETHLRNWFTEGQSASPQPGSQKEYSILQMGFPHGGGIKYGISRHLMLQWEWCFYDFPFSDYIDDVSKRYATYAEIERNFPGDLQKQTLAKYITDPSGWGSDGENGKSSSPRGNPKKFDWVNYMNFQLFFTPLVKAKSYNPRHHLKHYCPQF